MKITTRPVTSPMPRTPSTPAEIEWHEKAAIAARAAAVRSAAWVAMLATLVALIACVLVVRTTNNVIALCEENAGARIELAQIKEQRAALILPGPDRAERRALILAEAAELRRLSDASSCRERYRLP